MVKELGTADRVGDGGVMGELGKSTAVKALTGEVNSRKVTTNASLTNS